MDRTYIVKPGDTFPNIASKFGLSSWKAIYFAEENKAYRATRPNPDRIFPGDSLVIPGAQPGVQPSVTIPDQIPLLATEDMMAGKFPGGCLWAVQFRLPRPAVNSGYIVQEVLFRESGTPPSGGRPVAASKHYWEAWPVAKGNNKVTDPNSREKVAKFVKDLTRVTLPAPKYQKEYNDILMNFYAAGQKGRAEWRAVATFYEVTLPTHFVRNHPKTNSGRLLSTTISPTFWHGTGLMRRFTFEFDFQKTRTTADGILKAGFLATGTLISEPTMETAPD